MENKNNKIIETIGTIEKKETLASLEHAASKNALVIETIYPFPGYHGDTIPDKDALIPHSLFLILRQAYPEEVILRVSHAVRKKFKKTFSAVAGQVEVLNQVKPCIRIHDLKDYHDIGELIALYREHDINFMRYRNILSYSGMIKVKKSFTIQTIVPGLYSDVADQDMGYIQLPGKLPWKDFESITLHMKRNMENIKFDAALGMFIRKNCIVDVIRIFERNIDQQRLEYLKEKYMSEIKKL